MFQSFQHYSIANLVVLAFCFEIPSSCWGNCKKSLGATFLPHLLLSIIYHKMRQKQCQNKAR